VPVRLLNLAWHRLGWPPAELLASGSFDVTHSSHPLILPARHAAKVVTIHDLDFLSHPERTRGEIRRDYPTLAPVHAKQADAILVPSNFTAGEVSRRLGVPADKIAVCPAGAPAWNPRAEEPADGYVLFLGTLEARKNLGTLLDAYERLASRAAAPLARLVLAGRATDDAAPWLERLTRPPLAGLVQHVGYVAPDKRRELYAGARLLVQPSYDEGFGLPVLEAMATGVPVVAADRGALPEVLGDAGPLVPAGDPEAFAQAIDRMLSDRAFRTACAGRGIERAREFNWDRTARRVWETYRAAIARRAGGTTRPRGN
jgi:glycosyltransferase involved in cell wall biosynthesis